MHEWYEFQYLINVDIDIGGFDIDFIILTLGSLSFLSAQIIYIT